MQDMMLMVNYFLGFAAFLHIIMNSMLWSMVIFLILRMLATSGVPQVSVPGLLLFTIMHQ